MNEGFIFGSRVLMADYSTKCISEIKVGDYVMGFDLIDDDFRKAKIKPVKVLEVFDNGMGLVSKVDNIVDNHTMYIGRNTSLLSDKGIKNVKRVKEGKVYIHKFFDNFNGKLWKTIGCPITISDMKSVKTILYNLKTETGTFILNNNLVIGVR